MLISKQNPLVLASASPRRRELLELAGVPLQVRESRIAEEAVPGETAEDFTRRIARHKAESVAAACEAGRFVLGADTTVVLDGEVLQKPGDEAEAKAMLRRLSGRSHRVLTAVCVLGSGSSERGELLESSEVTFRELSDTMIAGYVATGEPMDKAGAYGIQGRAAMLVRSVRGSYTNVVGLPLCETMMLLERLGAFRPFSGSDS